MHFCNLFCALQGFEVVIHGRKYFAFSKYTNATSFCDETLPGWTHDVLGHDWACYYGRKVDMLQPKSTPQYLQFVFINLLLCYMSICFVCFVFCLREDVLRAFSIIISPVYFVHTVGSKSWHILE